MLSDTSDLIGKVKDGLEAEDHFANTRRITISILIATIAVISAVVGWLVAQHLDRAGELDSGAIAALIDDTDARTRVVLRSVGHESAFTTYTSQMLLAQNIGTVLRRTDLTAGEREALELQRAEALNRTVALDETFFPLRYADPATLTYNSALQLGEEVANALQDVDTHFQERFIEAREERLTAQSLMKIAIVLGLAILFLTVAYGARRQAQQSLAICGAVALVFSVAGILLVEYGSWQP